jgi:hypothetical protein
MTARLWAILAMIAIVAVVFFALAVGAYLSRRQRGAGQRAMAAREAETEPASHGAPNLHVRTLSNDDAAHVRWASALSRELPALVTRPAEPVFVDVPSDFDRHVATVFAILNRPDAMTLALRQVESKARAGIDAFFASLPEWARVEVSTA